MHRIMPSDRPCTASVFGSNRLSAHFGSLLRAKSESTVSLLASGSLKPSNPGRFEENFFHWLSIQDSS